MKKLVIWTLAIFASVQTFAQQELQIDSCLRAWEKPYASAKEIVDEYHAHDHTTVLDDCCMIWQAGNYIKKGKGQQQDIQQLLSSFPTIDLTNETVIAFMKKLHKRDGIQLFIGNYYLLIGMKKGYSLDDSRDGIFFTVYFPFRAPSQNDYEKMTDIFSTTNPTLQTPYLKALDFVMMNWGCTDGLENLKTLIEKNVAEGELKQKALQLYAQYEPLRKGKPAPKSIFKDAKGKEHSFTELKGKVVVVDVWASWCGSCLEKMPHFAELAQKFEHRKDIAFVLLSTDRNKSIETWKKNMEKYEKSGIKIWRADVENGSSFENDYNICGLPRYIVINAQGNMSDAFAPTPDKGLEKIIEETLQK